MTISVRVDPGLLKPFDDFAESKNWSRSLAVEIAMEKLLDAPGKPAPKVRELRVDPAEETA